MICGGSQAWLKASDSRSDPEGVPGFESQPPHLMLKMDAVEQVKRIGYSERELQSIPGPAIMGLGCGNPTALADLKEGETVLDLGSGAGVDVFLAANKVGPKGRVIGVDMTEEMVNRANEIAKKHGYKNVEFKLGEIENLPLEDSSVDVIISNCVINLSPDKLRTYREAYRVLKSGGRILISDLVTGGELPSKLFLRTPFMN